ncbi:hypothetical protein AA313_de0206938 [Arthrobotrys entomopaga]|nr:hypothetical protein AA313_de0206938 [Arthrobotrys entomopaga]
MKKNTELLEKLQTLGKSGHEKAIIALGAVSLIYDISTSETQGTEPEEKDQPTKIKEILTGIHDSKMPELSFATGEALSVFVAGWDSQILARKMDLVDGKVVGAGDKSLKEELVRNLVSSFTGTTKTLAGQVQADTQLFEPGALPTGDGSVSTYKDILSLASEVGDSSLVYKFMSLASHSAMWSSRAAFGRFGLGTIMSNSEEMFAENPKLYAKLFRYRFDPNPNVQRSMNDIWKALVKNPSATIDKYFDDIMEDLLKTIIDREWRTREASCGAIADLVQGRQPYQVRTH